MRTFKAQRLKKQAENEYKNRREMIAHLLEEAKGELEKRETLFDCP